MGKVLYSATMSVDGYIAGPGGDMSWLAPYIGPNPEIDALLIGGRTFRGTWTGPSFVVTHNPPAELDDGTPLFHHPGGRSVRLERISANTAPLATDVWMRVVR